MTSIRQGQQKKKLRAEHDLKIADFLLACFFPKTEFKNTLRDDVKRSCNQMTF